MLISSGGVRNRSTRSPSSDRKSPSSPPPNAGSGSGGLGIGGRNDHGKLHHGQGGQQRRRLRWNKALLVFAGALLCAFALCLLGMWGSYSATTSAMKRGGFVRQMADVVDIAKSQSQTHGGIRRRRHRRPGGEEEELFPVHPDDTDNVAGEEAAREEKSSPPPRNHPKNGDAKHGGAGDNRRKDWKELHKGQRGKTHDNDRPPPRRDRGEEKLREHRVQVAEHFGKDLKRRRFTKPMMESPTLIDRDNRQRRSKKKGMAPPSDDDEVEESADDDTDDDDGGGNEEDNSLSDDRRRGEKEKRKSPSSVSERISSSPVKVGGVGGPSNGRPRVVALEFQYFVPGESESSEIHNRRGGKPKFNPKIDSHTHALLTRVDALPPHHPPPKEPSDRYVTLYPDDDKYEDRLKDIVTKSGKYKGNGREPLEDDECKARHEWQKGAYPVCNILHEYELGQLSTMFGRAERRGLRRNEGEGEEIVRHLSNGYWRDVWLLSKASGSFDDDSAPRGYDSNNETSSSSSRYVEEITVLKTLRYEHDFTDRNYERHRKDALASERLSRSPNVVDIFAYCSDSAVFEYGKGGDIDSRLWQYDEEEEKYLVRDIPSIEKIDMAYQVARAIADMQDLEGDGYAPIAHTDITPSQFIFINGRWKLNDFNRCRFMRVRKEDGSPCGFYVGANPGKFRAPEEYAFEEENEMVDIFSMGNIFFSILSGDSPFEGEKESKAQKKVIVGKRPVIPDEVLKSDDIAIQAILSVTKMCWEQDPKDRPKASVVRDQLKSVMDKMRSDNPSRES